MGTEESQSTHRDKNISRRNALKLGGVLAAGTALAPGLLRGQAHAQAPKRGGTINVRASGEVLVDIVKPDGTQDPHRVFVHP